MSTSTSTSKTSKKKWYPLESNPAAINHYISKLGFNTSIYSFVDVYAIDEEALAYIPKGCIGIIMLYPLTDVQEGHRKQEQLLKDQERDKQQNPDDKDHHNNNSNDVWFIKQRIGNACGTIGILHTLANISPIHAEITITPNSWLHNFYSSAPASMSPITKAELLESNDEIEKHHDESTSDTTLNQTSRGNIDDKVMTHFVSIVNVNNEVYELDGRKEGAIWHGKTNEDTFLYDGINVVKKFMERDPNEYRFTILALVPTQE